VFTWVIYLDLVSLNEDLLNIYMFCTTSLLQHELHNFPFTHSEHFFVGTAFYDEFVMFVDLQEAFGYFRWSLTVSVGNFVVSDLVVTMLHSDCLNYVFLTTGIFPRTRIVHSLTYFVDLIITQICLETCE